MPKSALHNLQPHIQKTTVILLRYLAMRSLLPRSTLPTGAPTP